MRCRVEWKSREVMGLLMASHQDCKRSCGRCLTTESIELCYWLLANVLGSPFARRFCAQMGVTALSKFYGQAERAISTGKQRALRRFHFQPIKQVVFLCPSCPLWVGRYHLGECFTL